MNENHDRDLSSTSKFFSDGFRVHPFGDNKETGKIVKSLIMR